MALALFASMPAYGSESEVHSDAGESEESHRNVVSFLAGVAVKDRRDGPAVGVDYVRHFGKMFGVGVGAERTFGSIDASVFTLPFSFRTGRWKTWIGPGIEHSEHGSEGLVRIGGEYSFEVGHWEVSPQMNLDFLKGEQELVLGAAFGYGF
jgi:hypothetical protein